MTQTNTPIMPAVKLNTDSVMSGDVFYGSFDTMVKNKRISVTVSNHLKDVNKEYKFRVAAKCQAGFISISDWIDTPVGIIGCWKKNALVNVQVEIRKETMTSCGDV